MDYYQGVVMEYLRRDRSMFLNPECCIHLDPPGKNGSLGKHWYCDMMAASFNDKTAYLCEVSYAKGLGALLRRLTEWNTHWPEVEAAIKRDCRFPPEWRVRPWLFIPENLAERAVSGFRKIGLASGTPRLLPEPRITTLEAVAPWNYPWNRQSENLELKPACIPETMRQ